MHSLFKFYCIFFFILRSVRYVLLSFRFQFCFSQFLSSNAKSARHQKHMHNMIKIKIKNQKVQKLQTNLTPRPIFVFTVIHQYSLSTSASASMFVFYGVWHDWLAQIALKHNMPK